MRKLISMLAVAVFVAMPALALGGDSSSGFDCTNACPLAKKANTRRATGTEAAKTSVKMRLDVSRKVAKNLEKI